MSPPAYPKIGVDARNVFSKGYHIGIIKFELKTKSSSGVTFNTGGSSNQENGKILGYFECKYKSKKKGITFTEKWNTDNILGTEINFEDTFMKHLNVGAEYNFSPITGKKNGAISTTFADNSLLVSAEGKFIDFSRLPVINLSAVFEYQGWLAGYQTAYDLSYNKLTKNNVALSFIANDFILHTNVDDGAVFGASIYHKVSSNLETGVNMSWKSNSTSFGVAGSYNLDQDASVRGRINNSCEIGLGYQQRLRGGITLSLSAHIDGRSFNSGAHKLGLCLEMEA